MVSGSFQHMPPVPQPAPQPTLPLQTSSPMSVSQEMTSNVENVQDQKPNIAQQRTAGILNNLSQARQVISSATLTAGTSMGLPSMGGTQMAMHMSNMISSGMTSSVPPQTMISSGQSGITSIGGPGPLIGTPPVTLQNSSNMAMSQPVGPSMNQGNLAGPPMVSGMVMNQNMMGGGLSQGGGISAGSGSMMPTPGMSQPGMGQPGMSQQVQSGMQSMGVNANSSANMALSQPGGAGLQSAQSKYVKVWEVRSPHFE